MKLFLNCWVVGSDPETAFFVEIEENTYVSQLKDLIKEKRAPHLNHVAASDLQLWQVSIPSDDLEKELENINLAGYTKLPSGKKLAAFFTNVEDDRLHVIAKAPVIQTAPVLSPTPLLSLNCFVLGGTHNQNFIVDIAENKYVSHLKDMIKEKRAPHLNHVAASDLQLWQVSIPVDDLEKEIENTDFARLTELPPSKELSALFTNVERGRLQVIVDTPLLSLNCFLLGDDSDRTFTVKIQKNEPVSLLRDLIKEKQAPHLNHVAASDLHLWNVSFPIDDLPSKKPPTLGPKMRSEKFMSAIFRSRLDTNCVHVVIRAMTKGAPLRGPPPSAYMAPVVSTDELAAKRERFLKKRKAEAPSAGGNPDPFLKAQLAADGNILCNRPHGYASTLPISLLHPVFGDFVEDAKDYVPTPDDAKFLLAFVQAMANIYTNERSRQQEIHTIFHEHKIDINGTSIGPYTTDGDLSFGRFRLLIAEFKNEVGSKGAEPFFQAILYFLEATRILATQHLNSVLPCILVLVFGPYVAFAGAAWTDRPVVQMLSPAIPCHYHNTDIEMEGMLRQSGFASA
ncbi:hypothetical protein GALMADRAFT_1233107 [Galerina marginata CBS 339.88]|uniref:Crinkler effector protein N-terminal domain-containing protein n=1 Tax=Galerina marginata (strain CBS 339.88) TaxID=685588 RepID=A0A067T847_GALM3|nr:hypothetical protein GALMADRAFT_1233107 [Galerina marginata CBS 339.88]